MNPTVTSPAPAPLTLAWGLPPAPAALAAWGARAIPEGRGFALLPDRQGACGEEAAVSALVARLNGQDAAATLPGEGLLADVRRAWRDACRMDERATLHDDGVVRVEARLSGGYLYMVASLLRLPAPEPEVARVERLAAQSVYTGSEDVNRTPADVAEALRFNRAVRLGALALQPFSGGVRVVACEADAYVPADKARHEAKPRRPSEAAIRNGRAYGYGSALRDWRQACDDVERANEAADREARRADWRAWLQAAPTVRGTHGVPVLADGNGRADWTALGRLLVRAAREGWTGDRLAQACERACRASYAKAEQAKAKAPVAPQGLPWVHSVGPKGDVVVTQEGASYVLRGPSGEHRLAADPHLTDHARLVAHLRGFVESNGGVFDATALRVSA